MVEHDGVGRGHMLNSGYYLMDLGKTAASRRMKRDYFTFTFACDPFRRLVSAYGTITARGPGGGGAIMREGLFAAPFTHIARTDEPRRFETFVRDLQARPDMLFENETRRLKNPVIDNHGEVYLHARSQMYYLTSTDRHALTFGSARAHNIPPTPYVKASRAKWLVTVRSPRLVCSDNQPRRLDFVGRVERFNADMLRLLKLLRVPLSVLSKKQQSLLASTRRVNGHEGFKGAELETARTAILDRTSDATREAIGAMYAQDHVCLDYPRLGPNQTRILLL